MKTKIIKDATWLLNDTIAYYSKDIRRRCVGKDGLCRYSSKTINSRYGAGCAIGRHLTPANRLEADSGGVMSVGVLITNRPHLIPRWMKKINVSILDNIQFLHDNNLHWCKSGLSSAGKKYVALICCLSGDYNIRLY